MGRLDAHEKTIKQMIEGSTQYIIPLYQRAYEWNRKEWKDLWDDLIDQYEDKSSNKHFLGSIVKLTADASPGEVTKYQLIDGQQRLTTIFVILAVLRDRIKTYDEVVSEKIQKTLIINEYESDDNRLKLLSTQWDRHTFRYVVEPNDSDLNTRGTVSLRIKYAYDFFGDCIKEFADLDLEKLRNTLISKFIVISIDLKESEDSVYRIFETLNHRGSTLS
jgi:uncharacterized protein with ParB-like and HNH nuclease domain